MFVLEFTLWGGISIPSSLLPSPLLYQSYPVLITLTLSLFVFGTITVFSQAFNQWPDRQGWSLPGGLCGPCYTHTTKTEGQWDDIIWALTLFLYTWTRWECVVLAFSLSKSSVIPLWTARPAMGGRWRANGTPKSLFCLLSYKKWANLIQLCFSM